MGTENVASKKYTAARWSFIACMMIWSRRSWVASGSAASSPAIRAATLSLLPANPLGARPSVALRCRVAGVDERAVEPLHDLVVDLRADRQAQLRAAPAGPDARRLAVLRDGGQVVVLPAGRDGARQVSRVIAAGDRQHRAPFPTITGSP